MTSQADLIRTGLDQLTCWFNASAAWWSQPDAAGNACYGTGVPHWGTQGHFTATAACAILGHLGATYGIDAATAAAARQRALAGLRWGLANHLSGPGTGDVALRWGKTWISALALERAASGIALILHEADEDDRQAWYRVLTVEAEHAAHHHERGGHHGIPCGLGGEHGGCNAPESNLWCAAICWRAACTLPDDERAPAWRERAIAFFANGFSIAADADDERLVDGIPLSERHVGPNFFPHFSLPHHNYTNVGYMVICTSQVAMIGLDAEAAGWPLPEAADHHGADFWPVMAKLIFEDGRLARVGGDSRARYCYCQDYLPVSLCWAARRGWIGDIGGLLAGHLAFTAADQAADGSFLGQRLAAKRINDPMYYTRLEGDRAIGIAQMALALHRHPDLIAASAAGPRPSNGHWHDADDGVVLHRCPTRLASVAWNAHGHAQGLCLPPDDGSLAEWRCNLGGRIDILGDHQEPGGQTPFRRILHRHSAVFDGGFATAALLSEGHRLTIAEGWVGDTNNNDRPLPHVIAMAALPDGHTMLGLNLAEAGEQPAWISRIRGLHLSVPNDTVNGHRRHLAWAGGERDLLAPAETDEVLDLGSWAVIDGRLAAIGLGGADALQLQRSPRPGGDRFGSILLERLAYPCWQGMRRFEPGAPILDIGWAVLSAVDAAATATAAAGGSHHRRDRLRATAITGQDGRRYALCCNCGAQPLALTAADGETLGLAVPAGLELAPYRCQVLGLAS